MQITRVEKSTYYAELHIERGDELVHIDARPSDSIAIALRLAAPIFAAEIAAGRAGEDDEDDERRQPGSRVVRRAGVPRPIASELTAEQLKEYLENLRPEDFGKFNL